jgi:enterochelin esterase family protein
MLARVTIEVPYQPIPVGQTDVHYAHGPDSAPQPDVPVGETVEFDWNDSAIYPGCCPSSPYSRIERCPEQ